MQRLSLRQVNGVVSVLCAKRFVFASKSSSFQTPLKEKPSDISPKLTHIPSSCRRLIGREGDVNAVYQGILSGHRIQVIGGVDGIGKTAVATAFAETASRSERFTCVYWFDASKCLQTQMTRFLRLVKGRKEHDALLIMDDVRDPKRVQKLFPPNDRVYCVATSSNTVDWPYNVHYPKPIQDSRAADLLTARNVTMIPSKPLLERVGFVPLLTVLAAPLMEHGIEAEEIIAALDRDAPLVDGVISVKTTAKSLINLALEQIKKSLVAAMTERGEDGEKAFQDLTRVLQVMSFLDTNNLTMSLVEQMAADSPQVLEWFQTASEFELLNQMWDSDKFSMHSVVAAALRANSEIERQCEAISLIELVWPRRYSEGGGAELAWALVNHVIELHRSVQDVANLPKSVQVRWAKVLERAASYLLNVEGKDLQDAIVLLDAAVEAHKASGTLDSTTAGFLFDQGRAYIKLEDHTKAAELLHKAHETAVQVHGEDAPETALVVANLARYLPQQSETIAVLSKAEKVLALQLEDEADVMSREERGMVCQCRFILLVAMGRLNESLGLPMSEQLWKDIEEAHKTAGGVAN